MESSSQDLTRNYFEKEMMMLKICGASLDGNEGAAYKIYAAIILFLTLTYPLISFRELFKHDLQTVSDLLIYQFSTTIANVELLAVLFNREKLRKLLTNLQQPPFLPNMERGGDEENRLVKRYLSITKTQSILCWISLVGTVTMAAVVTLVKRIRSSDYHDWEFAYGPITVINVTYSPNYEITWLYQIICDYSLGFNYSTINLIMAGILAHTSLQFKILQNNIKRVVENSFRIMMKDTNGGKHSLDELKGSIDASVIHWKYLKKCLEAVINYHLRILGVVDEMGEIFGAALFLAFLLSLGTACFLVYHASMLSINDMRFLKSLTDTMSGLFPIFLISYWSEEVAFESQQVGKAVNEAHFAGTDIRFQKSLNMIIRRSQNPTQLQAGKIVQISLSTFVWIVRTSYSTFMVLRKMNNQ